MKRPILLIAALLAMLAPSGARAASIVNGDFETGTLSGWHVHSLGAGDWFAYEGTAAPIGHKRGADPIQAPPQGAHALIADQANPDTAIIYQDIDLEPGSNYRLSLLAYYNSYKPIAVPSPDTLSVDDDELEGQANQQYRIDLMKPEAPIESLDPADILRTLFRTQPGDPAAMPPTRLTASLGPYAGQTVRLRVATAAHEEVLNAGIDTVSISSPSGNAPARGSSRFSFDRVKTNRRNGTATLFVRVPGAGLLTATGESRMTLSSGAAGKGKVLRKTIKSETAKTVRASTVSLHLRPNPLARETLEQRHRLRARVTVVYLPTGEPREVASLPVVLRLSARSSRR
jgi:hypothetical protein